MSAEKVKYLVVHVMDRVSLLISVWLLVLVKMVEHVLLLMMVVIDVPVRYSILDITVQVMLLQQHGLVHYVLVYFRNIFIWV